MLSALRAAAWIGALLLLAPAVVAGSGSDPEVSDPPGDTTDEITGAPSSAPGADLLAAWFTESPSTFSVHLRVSDLREAQPGVVDHWAVLFRAQGADHRAEAQRSVDGLVASLSTPGRTGPNTLRGDASGSADLVAETISLTFPRAFELDDGATRTPTEFVGGTTFAAPFAESRQGHGTSDTGLLLLRVDRTATGRDFTFATQARYATHSGDSPGEPITTKSVTGDGVALSGSGSGTFDAFVFVAGNHPKSFTFNGQTHPLAEDGTVTLAGFSGTYAVTHGNVKFEGTATGYHVG